MRRVLLTGMSGAGTSTVVRRLVALGHKAVEEWARVLQDVREIEPRLRRTAHHVISTTAPEHQVVAAVLAVADLPPDG